MLNKQMEDLRLADSKGDYTTTWKIDHDLSGKDKKSSVKFNKRDGTQPTNDKDLLSEWREYTSSLLNNSNGEPLSELPPPAAHDLPIDTNSPRRYDILLASRQMKKNKAAGLDSAITAEALQNDGDAMADIVHDFCTYPIQPIWTTSIIVQLPTKGNLSLMTNYREISLPSITAKVFNKIPLNRIRDHVDPILRSN